MAATRPGLLTLISRWSKRINAWSAVHIGLTAGLIIAAGLWVSRLEPVVEHPGPSSRPATATAPPATPTTPPFQAQVRVQETIYIVGSEAKAKELRLILQSDAGVRFHYEQRPFPDLVLVAGSDAEATALMEVLNEGNRMRESMRQSDVRIVDLREAAGTSTPAGTPGRRR